MKSRDAIKERLISELRKRAPKGILINGDSKIIDDLRLISDDATEVVLVLQKATGAKPPTDAWLGVHTVDEAVDLLWEYVPDRSEPRE